MNLKHVLRQAAAESREVRNGEYEGYHSLYMMGDDPDDDSEVEDADDEDEDEDDEDLDDEDGDEADEE